MAIRVLLERALHEAEDEFKHDYETLSNTVAPSMGWETYKEIVREEADQRRRGAINPRADRPYQRPLRSHTGEEYGPRDQFGRVVPWSVPQVLDAIKPLIMKYAKQYTQDKFKHGGFGEDDAFQMGQMGVIKALEKDEARPGNSFVTMAKPWILAYIANGFGDPIYRKARGILGELYTITASLTGPDGRPTRYVLGASPEDDERVIGAIEDLITQPRGKEGRTQTKPLGSGAYGKLEQPIRDLAVKLIATIRNGDATAFAATRKGVEAFRKEVDEMEKLDRTPGAKTSDTIRTSHAAAPIRTTGLEVQNPQTGATAPIAGLPSQRDATGNVAQKETIALMLARATTPARPGERPRNTLSTPQLKVLLRVFGLTDYPGKGTVKDPELDPNSVSHLSLWATPEDEVYAYDAQKQPIMGLGMREMEVKEIAAELGVTTVRIQQHKAKALKHLSAGIEDVYTGFEDDPDFAGQMGEDLLSVHREVLREVRQKVARMIIADIYAERYPEIIFS